MLDRYRGVPLTVVTLGVVAGAIHTLTQRMRFGRHLYASGDNPEAARLSGINVQRVTIIGFAIMGAV